MPQEVTRTARSVAENTSTDSNACPENPKCPQPKISSKISHKLTQLLSKDLQVRENCTRLVSSKGRVNVSAANVENKKRLYLADPFTTLLDAKWQWIFLAFAAGFVSSWLVFGSLWWIIIWLRAKFNSTNCVENVDSWLSAFLFSVETQTTIGYGGRQVTPECPEGVICLLVQSLTGLMLSASLLGLIFAKLSRPRPRAQTLRFSRRALVNTKDGQLRLVFRVGDIRKSQLLEVTIKLHCFQFITGDNGSVSVIQSELPISFSSHSEPDIEVRPFFLTPLTIIHVIDEQSPFYHLSAKEMCRADLELVAVLEGVVESTGMVTQARASYVATEITWGQEFYPLVLRLGDTSGRVQIDYSLFDHTYASTTPICSARELQERKEQPVPAGEKTEVSTDVWVPRKNGPDTQAEA